MGNFSENLKRAADNAERLASALESLPSTSGDQGASYAPVIPTQVVFNTTVSNGGLRDRQRNEGLSGGGGGDSTGEIGRANNGGLSEEIIRAFAYYGLRPGGQSEKRIAEILRLFRAMRAGKGFEMMMRTEGM